MAYKCVYTGTAVVGERQEPCRWETSSEVPCLANVNPPPNLAHCGNMVLTSQAIDTGRSTGKKVAGAVVGAGAGLGAVVGIGVLIGSGPPGWLVLVGGALCGGGLGWFASS